MARAKREYSFTRTGNGSGVAADCPERELSYMVSMLFGVDEDFVVNNNEYKRQQTALYEIEQARERVLRGIRRGEDPVLQTPEERDWDKAVDGFVAHFVPKRQNKKHAPNYAPAGAKR